jgi:hypothetical protein
VRQAIEDLDAGDAASAATRLEEYLSTGPCKDGNIGTPDLLKRRPDGTLDLGLSLFRIAEHYGRRFGEEEIDSGVDEEIRARRHAETECARRLAEAIADDPGVPLDQRARARYLAGNLAFLDGDYEGAVRAYDRALVLAPGEPDAADSLGRDAAWNRAIAQRRIEEKKDAGQDASSDAGSDGGSPDAGGDSSGGPKDAGRDDRKDGGGGHDGGPEAGPDAGVDAGEPPPAEPPDAGREPQEAGAPPPPNADQDERMLDQLESAPTLQQEEAKRAGRKRVRGMADK